MTFTVDHLSSCGEGVVRTENGPVFVPFALPGETVALDGDNQLISIVTPSPSRAEPFCPAFGRCGGCAMQHMQVDAYGHWKTDVVRRALEREGLVADVQDTIVAHGQGRRRAIVHVRFGPDGPTAGFMAARSHNLQSLDVCPVLVPELASVFDVARRVTLPLLSRNKPLDVQISATLNGLDVDIRGHGQPDPDERRQLTAIANKLDLARLSVHRGIVVERKPATVMMADIPVNLPPRAFLQATSEAEQTLARLVADNLGKAKSVVDLFCGVGPFALRIAQTSKVHAVDDVADGIDALLRGARSRQGLKQVTAEARDLFKRPLLPMELNTYDVVVMDPPRAGAEAQSKHLATSKVKKVISVSCDLQSFIRDAKILIAGGFKLGKVTPVDQFAWSKHIELVGIFQR
ncbi:MAG: class I SAM-dependent RNA methyltransferase [Beijerinckiaceae bacterium]